MFRYLQSPSVYRGRIGLEWRSQISGCDIRVHLRRGESPGYRNRDSRDRGRHRRHGQNFCDIARTRFGHAAVRGVLRDPAEREKNRTEAVAVGAGGVCRYVLHHCV